MKKLYKRGAKETRRTLKLIELYKQDHWTDEETNQRYQVLSFCTPYVPFDYISLVGDANKKNNWEGQIRYEVEGY